MQFLKFFLPLGTANTGRKDGDDCLLNDRFMIGIKLCEGLRGQGLLIRFFKKVLLVFGLNEIQEYAGEP